MGLTTANIPPHINSSQTRVDSEVMKKLILFGLQPEPVNINKVTGDHKKSSRSLLSLSIIFILGGLIYLTFNAGFIDHFTTLATIQKWFGDKKSTESSVGKNQIAALETEIKKVSKLVVLKESIPKIDPPAVKEAAIQKKPKPPLQATVKHPEKRRQYAPAYPPPGGYWYYPYGYQHQRAYRLPPGY